MQDVRMVAAKMSRDELRGAVSQLVSLGRSKELTALLVERPSVVSEPWFAEVATDRSAERAVAAYHEHIASITAPDVTGLNDEQLLACASHPLAAPTVIATILREYSSDRGLRRACVSTLARHGNSIDPMSSLARALGSAMIAEDDTTWRRKVESLHRYHRTADR